MEPSFIEAISAIAPERRKGLILEYDPFLLLIVENVVATDWTCELPQENRS